MINFDQYFSDGLKPLPSSECAELILQFHEPFLQNTAGIWTLFDETFLRSSEGLLAFSRLVVITTGGESHYIVRIPISIERIFKAFLSLDFK